MAFCNVMSIAMLGLLILEFKEVMGGSVKGIHAV